MTSLDHDVTQNRSTGPELVQGGTFWLKVWNFVCKKYKQIFQTRGRLVLESSVKPGLGCRNGTLASTTSN